MNSMRLIRLAMRGALLEMETRLEFAERKLENLLRGEAIRQSFLQTVDYTFVVESVTKYPSRFAGIVDPRVSGQGELISTALLALAVHITILELKRNIAVYQEVVSALGDDE